MNDRAKEKFLEVSKEYLKESLKDCTGKDPFPYPEDVCLDGIAYFLEEYEYEGRPLVEQDKEVCWKEFAVSYVLFLLQEKAEGGKKFRGVSARDMVRRAIDLGILYDLKDRFGENDFSWRPISSIAFDRFVLTVSLLKSGSFEDDAQTLFTLSDDLKELHGRVKRDLADEEKDPEGFKIDFKSVNDDVDKQYEMAEESIGYLINQWVRS